MKKVPTISWGKYGLLWGTIISLLQSLLSPFIISINTSISSRASPFTGSFSTDLFIYFTLSLMFFFILLIPCVSAAVLLSFILAKFSKKIQGMLAEIIAALFAFLLSIFCMYIYIWIPDEVIYFTGKSFFHENLIYILYMLMFYLLAYKLVGDRIIRIFSKKRTLNTNTHLT